MARDEQVRIDLVAEDNASKKIDKVADAVSDLERLDPEVEVAADTDRAERGLEQVEDDAKALERLSPEIEVAADTDKAESGLKEVDSRVDALDGRKVTVDMSGVISELDSLKARAKETGDRLDHVSDGRGGGGGGNLRGQAIADLTGPLGDVSGKASDLAGVFDGLGDTLGGLGGRFGVSQETIEKALGGISFGVAGAVALWGLYKQRQEEAKRKADEMIDSQRELNKLLGEAKFDEAAKKLVDDYDSVYDAAERAGIPVQEVTEFLAGYSDDLPTVTKKIQEISNAQKEHGETTATLVAQYTQLTNPIYDAKNAIDQANGSMAEQDKRTGQATDALKENADQAAQTTSKQERLEAAASRTNDAFDRMSDAVNLDAEFHRFNEAIDGMVSKVDQGTGLASSDIDGLKQDIINLARDAGANPVQVKSTLDKIDAGDLAGVKADAERYYRNNPVSVATQFAAAGLNPNYGAALGPIGGIRMVPPTPEVPTVGVINLQMPIGWRGDPLAEAHTSVRRSGRHYLRVR